MALRLLIRPGEKIHFGTSNIIVVAETTVSVIVEGTIPVLRDRDCLQVANANTPARRAYLALQNIYLNDSVDAGRDDYFVSAKTLLKDLPSAADFIAQINGYLASREHYKALKVGRSVVQLDERAHSWAEVIASD